MQFLVGLYSLCLCRQHSKVSLSPELSTVLRHHCCTKQKLRGTGGAGDMVRRLHHLSDHPQRRSLNRPHSTEQAPISIRPLHWLFKNIQIASGEPDCSRAVPSDPACRLAARQNQKQAFSQCTRVQGHTFKVAPCTPTPCKVAGATTQTERQLEQHRCA